MQDPLISLQQVVTAIQPLDGDDWPAFAEAWKPFSAKRKEIMTRAGERERWLYFVTEGVQRVYYHDEQEREATIVFSYPPSFSGVLDAFLLQHPSRYNFEALTPSKFLRASYESIHELMSQRPAIASMIHKGVSLSLSGLLERLAELQSFTSEEKFRKLLQRSPHILGLVPQKYLANYLGIDPTNFSKLVNRIRI